MHFGYAVIAKLFDIEGQHRAFEKRPWSGMVSPV
jgi:hypothetical protein